MRGRDPYTAAMVRRRPLVTAAALVVLYAIASIPEPAWEPPDLADRAPFAWDQDDVWRGLETKFEDARARGCDVVGPEVTAHVESVATSVWALADAAPGDPRLDRLEAALFEASALTAACPDHLDALTAAHHMVRKVVRDAARDWDPADADARDRLYRLLYGSRMATEEVLLQLPPGAAPTLERGTEWDPQVPATTIQGLRIHSGDLLVSRGGAPTSAFIARGNTHPGNFSHVAMAHVAEDGTASIVESHIESGVGVFPVEKYLADKKLRILVLRMLPTVPELVANPRLPHDAAESALAAAQAGHIPYDFSMNADDGEEQFCSEVAKQGYAAAGVELWPGRRPLAARGAARWLGAVGARHFDVPLPSDLEYDVRFAVVAEWRDAETLFQDHLDNAILDALLEKAEAGDDLKVNVAKLAPARLAKALSWVMNRFGRVGPIPEGMSASTALRIDDLRGRHAKIRAHVLRHVASFRAEKGYTPPYWRLVDMAREAA